MAPSRIMRSFHLFDIVLLSSSLTLGRERRPRSGPPPLGPGAVGATPGVLDFGRQVRETLGLDGLRPDVQVEVVHTVDHHLG